MAIKSKILIGVIIITLLSSGYIYLELTDQVRLRIDNDKSTMYVPHETSSWIWVVGGREYNRLFDGNSILNRDLSSIKIETNIDDNNTLFEIRRTTQYQRGPIIRDTYIFDGDIKDIELFPISHLVEVFNASGFFYRYTVDELTGAPPKVKLSGETKLRFGRNISVSLHPGYRWAWIGWPYGDDSLSAQYEIDSDYEVFSVRLFDPVWDPNISTTPRTLNEDWESDLIHPSYWETWSSSIYGRIRVNDTEGTPHGGSYHLIMDVNQSINENRNALITKAGLFDNANNVTISVWVKEQGEEDDECPASWTGYDPGSSQGDCIAFTCDNNTWYKAIDLSPGPVAYTEYYYDFSQHGSWCGITNDTFRVWFGQDDNYPYSTDGMMYDDINITGYFLGDRDCPAGAGVYINSRSNNQDIEQGSPVTICGVSTGTVCINITGIGDNLNCSTDTVTYIWDSMSNEWAFNDSTSSKTYTSNSTNYINLLNDITMTSAEINVTGNDASGYPEEVEIILDGTMASKLVGEIVGDEGNISQLTDGSNHVEFSFAGSQYKYIEFSRNTTITGASTNLTGISGQNVTVDTFNDSSSSKTLEYKDDDAVKYVGITIAKGGTVKAAKLTANSVFGAYNRTIVTSAQTEYPWILTMNDTYVGVSTTQYHDIIYVRWYNVATETYSHSTGYWFGDYSYKRAQSIALHSPYVYVAWTDEKIHKYWFNGTPINQSFIPLENFPGTGMWANDTTLIIGDACSTDPTPPCTPTTNLLTKADIYSLSTTSRIETINYSAGYQIYGYWNGSRHITLNVDGSYKGSGINSFYPNGTYEASLVDLTGTYYGSEYGLGHSEDHYYTVRPTPYSPIGIAIWNDFYVNVANMTIDVGDDNYIDNTTNNWSGELIIDLNITAIQYYLDNNCIFPTCSIPIKITNESSGGWINFDDPEIIYSSTPEDVTLDVGDDGIVDWSQSGSFTSSIIADLNITAIQNYLDSSSCSGTACDIPLVFISEKGGIMNITDIVANYSFNPIPLNHSLIQTLLGTTIGGNTDVGLTINATSWGSVTVDDIDFEYDGHQNYSIYAYQGGTSYNVNASVYFSNWSYDFPSHINYIEYIPRTPTQNDVTPYGQTSTKPILNITIDDSNIKDASWYFLLNDTAGMTCINTTASTTTSKSDGYMIDNEVWYEFATESSPGSYFDFRLWTDYECNFTTWKMWQPDYYFRTCCEDCICSEEAV